MRKSFHYQADRFNRAELIRNYIGYGKVIASFRWDRGHRNGPEIHRITSTGIIRIYNERTHKLVTELIARPTQITRYFDAVGKTAPKELVDLAYYHTKMGYNDVY